MVQIALIVLCKQDNVLVNVLRTPMVHLVLLVTLCVAHVVLELSTTAFIAAEMHLLTSCIPRSLEIVLAWMVIISIQPYKHASNVIPTAKPALVQLISNACLAKQANTSSLTLTAWGAAQTL